MIFQSANLLWALSLVAIPIIIHLFRFKRYKKLLFSDVSLLKEVQTKSQTKNQLRHLLILACRILFIAFLVLAFARPFIPATNKEGTSQFVTVFVDNSFSMQNAAETGTLFNVAKQKAFEIIESYPESARFRLITNEMNAFQQNFNDKSAFIEQLDQTRISSIPADMKRLSRFMADESAKEGAINYLISDFIDVNHQSIDSSLNNRLRLIQLEGTFQRNISIDSVWINAPTIVAGSEERVYFSLSNQGNELVTDMPVDLYINNQLNLNLLLTLEAGEQIDTSMLISFEEAGEMLGRLEVEDQPVTFDNSFYFNVSVKTEIAVAEIAGASANSSPFKKLFTKENGAHYSEQLERNAVLDSIQKADFVILNEVENITSGMFALINNKLENGVNVFIVLPQQLSEGLKQKLADELGIKVLQQDSNFKAISYINLEDDIYKNVFESVPQNLNLPDCGKTWQLEKSGGLNGLMEVVNGDAVLASFNRKKAQFFVLAAPLSDPSNTFDDHALFVPTLFNAALFSGITPKLSHQTGSAKIKLNTRGLSEQTKIVSEDSVSIIPSVSYDGLYLGNQIAKPGFFSLLSEDKLKQKLAFNYSRKESNLMAPSSEQIVSDLASSGITADFMNVENTDLSNEISKADLGQELWHWALLIALLFFIIEHALLKFFSR